VQTSNGDETVDYYQERLPSNNSDRRWYWSSTEILLSYVITIVDVNYLSVNEVPKGDVLDLSGECGDLRVYSRGTLSDLVGACYVKELPGIC
jgi:hypothetical protein